MSAPSVINSSPLDTSSTKGVHSTSQTTTNVSTDGLASSFASSSSTSDARRYSNVSSSSLHFRSRLRILIVRHGETDYNVQGIIQGQMDTDLNDLGRKQAEYVGEILKTEQIDEIYSSSLKRASDTAQTIYRAHPNRAHGRLPFWFDNRLKERGFGTLEGNRYDRSKPKRDSIEGIEQTNVFCARLASFVSDAVVQSAPFEIDSEWIDEPTTPPTTYRAPGTETSNTLISGPPPQLNKAGCSRTILIVAHGAAISAMVGNVLLDSGIAAMSAGVQRTRIWNCSITEIIVHETDTLPLQSDRKLDLKSLSKRPGKKHFVVERWADVRHLPASLEEAATKGAANGSADEMVGRNTK